MNAPPRAAAYDVARVREDFPILRRTVRGHPLVYLDNAATTQKPLPVMDTVRRFYETNSANIHRGVHTLSEESTVLFDAARDKVRGLLGARDSREIVFVRGTTEAVNLVAQTFGRQRVGPGDEIVLTGLEHHSNIVPWQMLCAEKGAGLRVLPIDDRGALEMDRLEGLLNERTRLVAVAHVSNALGTVTPIREIVERAHARGIPVFVDGAQAVPRMPVDVADLDCDFYAFSGHKMYGPTGIGVLYGKAALLEEMPPWQGGGDMIRLVTFEGTTYNDIPYKFEAGTPNIAGVIGLGAAVDYLSGLGLARVAAHEDELLERAVGSLSAIPGIRLVGTAPQRCGVVSFTLDGIHPHDVGTILDHDGIAIRAGHHCAYPVMQRFGVPATARASFGVYNTVGEVDALAEGVCRVVEMFA